MRFAANDPRPTARQPSVVPQPGRSRTPARSYSVGAEAQAADGGEISIEINADGRDDMDTITAALDAAVAALGPGWNAESADTDE